MTKALDHWGYYNAGIPGNTMIPEFGANRNPNFNGAKRNALTKVLYPTGGSSIINYEQNDYSYTAANGPISGDLIEVEDHYFTYQGLNSIFLSSTPINVDYQSFYTVTIHWEYTDQNCCPNNQCSGSFLTSSGYLFPGQTYSDEYFITENIISSLGTECSSDYHIFAYITLNNVIAKNSKYGPGIRIKSIEKLDPISLTSELTEYKYKETADPTKSSGAINTSPLYIGEVYQEAISLSLSFYRNNSYVNLGSPMVIYESVDEIVNNTNRTNYSFSTYKPPYLDFYSYEAILPSNVETIGSFESYDFSRGVILSTKFFKNSTVLIKEINNEYSFRRVNGVGLQNSLEYKIPSMYYEGLTNTTFWNGSSNVHLPLYWNKFYRNVSSFFEKTKEKTITYKDNGEVELENESNYFYENESHLQLTKSYTLTSKKDTIESTIKYPQDYLNNPLRASFINQLIQENRLSAPIEKITTVKDLYSNKKVIDASVSTFKTFDGNTYKPTLLLPFKQFSFNRNSFGTISNPYDGSSDDISQNTSYREVAAINDYNKYGKIRSLTINKAENSVFLYAYKGLYPAGEIKNSLWTPTLQNVENQILDNSNSVTIWDALEALKPNFNSSLINTYVYRPLIGLEKTSTPNGLITLYNYDSFNRLFEVKEKIGVQEKLIKSYNYNYAH
jgi:hypothetical protein